MADQRQELGCLGAEKSFIALQCQLYLGIYGQLFPAQTAQGAVLVRFHGHDNPLILHRNFFQLRIDFRLAQSSSQSSFTVICQKRPDGCLGYQDRMAPFPVIYRTGGHCPGTHHPLYGIRKEHGKFGRQDEYPVA